MNNESDIEYVKIQRKRNKTRHCLSLFSTHASEFINSSGHNQHRQESFFLVLYTLIASFPLILKKRYYYYVCFSSLHTPRNWQ